MRTRQVCSVHGCPNLNPCPTHPKAESRWKSPEQAKYYGSTEWKKLRARVRAEEPFCRICRVKQSTNVDHEDGDWRNNERSNLRALCDDCEKARTGQQHGVRQGHGHEAPAPPPDKQWVWA